LYSIDRTNKEHKVIREKRKKCDYLFFVFVFVQKKKNNKIVKEKTKKGEQKLMKKKSFSFLFYCS